MENFEIMVKFNEYREEFMSETYVNICKMSLDFGNFEISNIVLVYKLIVNQCFYYFLKVFVCFINII